MLPEIPPKVALMAAVPAATAVARPPVLILATALFDELQVTCVVISWFVPSEYVPVAVNCWMPPTAMLRLAGVTDIEDKIAEVTVRVALPEMLPNLAVMAAVPAATAVTRPLLVTVAAVVFDEPQVTCVVMSKFVPSEYVPVAVNCGVSPTGMLGLAGVTDMEDRIAEVTVSVALPEMLPNVAVIFAVPATTAVASPLLLTVAADVFDELQATCVVISRVVPPDVTVAVNCVASPTGVLGLVGVTAMEDMAVAAVRVVLPEILPRLAVMVAVLPAATPVGTVTRPPLVTVATAVFDEPQITWVVISWLVPSEYMPIAVNCGVSPTGMLGLVGVITMEDKVAAVTVRIVVPVACPVGG